MCAYNNRFNPIPWQLIAPTNKVNLAYIIFMHLSNCSWSKLDFSLFSSSLSACRVFYSHFENECQNGQEPCDNSNIRKKKIHIIFSLVGICFGSRHTPYTTYYAQSRERWTWAAEIKSFTIYFEFFQCLVLLCGRPQNWLLFWLTNRVVSIMDFYLNFYAFCYVMLIVY